MLMFSEDHETDCQKTGSPFPTFHSLSRLLLIGAAALLLGACSWFGGGDSETGGAVLLPSLEIPPDLITPVGDPHLARPNQPTVAATKTAKPDSSKLAEAPSVDCRCNELPSIGQRVLPAGKGVQRMREGQRRWLMVQAEPEQVWLLVRGFLEMRGYRVERDEPAIGLLETDWKLQYSEGQAENQAQWRERLRIRIEPAEQAGNAEIFLTQRHSQRVSDIWELRPADVDRAVEMLNRLARHLAAKDVKDAVPPTPLNARIASDADGHTVLQLDTTFDKAWRRTSLALDALGFTIEDHNRANRIFHVYNELPSGLSEEELKFGKPKDATVREEYWLHVQERDEHINLSMHNKAGEVDESQVARHVLNLLLGQLQ